MATTYYLRVHIESAGTEYTGGGLIPKSLAGHMWYEIYQKDSNGNIISGDGKQLNAGYTSDGVVNNDGTNYAGDPAYSSKEILLTQEQFDTLYNFGSPVESNLSAQHGFGNDDYWVHSNSCIDYTWKALELAGLNPSGTEGALWPSANASLLGAYLFGDFAYNADNHSTIPSDMNGLFNSAQDWTPPRIDPLVFDIDGDGIETIQIDINSPILFDHDGDGVKTATGWVKSDDALLVLDRNANGTIDNGSELFGDQTLVNGVKATDGFAALSAEDSDANGIFDINDTNFGNVRLWQDLNQNGISETNELKTLTQAGIVSISLSSTQTNIAVNGGVQTAKGTFTKSDGTTGESATVDVGSVGNYLFDSNSFYREFTDTIPLTETASALPEMQGSGMVRDLREAMSMQTTEGAVLTDILTQYSSLTTHDEQIAFMDELLLAWGATSGFKDIATEATENGYTLTTNLNAEQFSMLNVLEQFNGRHFYRMPWESSENTTARLGMSVDETTKTISIDMFDGQLSILEQAYQELVESVYAGLVMQTRLAPYLDSITMNIDENGLTFDVAPMIAQLETLQLTSPRDALIDQLELIQYAGKNFSIMGWNWSETLQTMITQIGTQVDVKAVFAELGYMDSETSNIIYDVDGTNYINYYGDKNIILVGLDGNDTVYSGDRDDLIIGGKGDDILSAQDGNDTYIFNLGDGQDTIYDSSWNSNNKDTIRFGEGITSDNLDVTRINDNLVLTIQGTTDKITVMDYFMSTSSKIEEFAFADGTTLTSQQIESMVVLRGTDNNDSISGSMESDTINGKKGDDQLYGDDGDDTYIFNLGDGQDTIYDSSWNTNNKDIIRFGEGIASDNLDVTRINDNLVLTIQGTTDKITVMDYFMNTSSKIEEFAFADGATLTSQQIESMVVLRGTDGDDNLYGYEANDVFIGGKGNDYLDGQDGNDTYIFNLGDGQDTIYDSSWNSNNKDTIRFGEGITSDNLDVTRINDNLVLTIQGTTDKITVMDYFMSTSSKIEEFAFADGTTLTSQQIESMVVLRGTDNNDSISGFMDADTIIGGKGNDYLDGQDGNDTYIFNLGDGQDTIYDQSWNIGNNDIIHFGEGIVAADVTITQDQSNLYFTLNNSEDKITIANYFDAPEYQIEQVTFTDGTLWDSTMFNQIL
ncbi:MAG: calcium-binding protein [Sulfurimonas sp.]